MVRKAKSLIELFRVRDHFFHLIPRFARVAIDELFNLFELVDAEDAPHVSAVRAGFLAETA